MNYQNNPLVSVIVPVYNVEQYLDECLNSIRQQTYKNIEIIVVEDCSTDNSLNTLTKHLEDPRVKLIQHEKNSGLSAARNTGIDAANGDYIMFVDSDDYIDFNLIKLCLDNIKDNNTDIIIFDFHAFNDNEAIKKEKNSINNYKVKLLNEVEYLKYPHFAWLKFFKADILKKYSLRFKVGYYYEDWPFHWEIAFNGCQVLNINIPLYYYRLRKGSITSSGDQKLIHIFYSHRIIIEKMKNYNISLDAKKVLAKKIYNGLWFVLTQINSKYLNQTILEAKKQLDITNDIIKLSRPSFKTCILIIGLIFPNIISNKFIEFLRFFLNIFSSQRRNKKI
ncbi:glycosyltransferase family 2 protein [Acinetobacter radioresistens]|uniref:glycosyltransferase family 2 protein n=1 Tax=Acinetobacter radioresistens TaxID=40216 RepID=UPI000313A4E9|nr:glycosyltransferase family 2 protein [Acinetobacter radioresistens]